MSPRLLPRSASARNTQNEPFAILSVASNGDIGTFSPELLGMTHPIFGHFSLGNVLSWTHNGILNTETWPRLVADISDGTTLCRSGCEYFSVCGGGAPINKLYEKQSFITMETNHCRLTVKAIADVVLSTMEREIAIESPSSETQPFSPVL
jgi:uncharacterized protein